MGKTFFDDLVKHCKTDEAYASLKSVVTREKAELMHSFLFAETFKHFLPALCARENFGFQKSDIQYRGASDQENVEVIRLKKKITVRTGNAVTG